jgi:hypothetical protein
MGWKSFLGLSRPEKELARQLQKGLKEGQSSTRRNRPTVLSLGQGGMAALPEGTVSINNGTNITKVRMEVFTQNFLQRILVNILNETSRAGRINVDEYKKRLDNAQTEWEAILYYDELIALTHMLILYGIIIELSESQLKDLEDKYPDHMYYFNGLLVDIDEKQKKAFGLTMKIMQASVGTGTILTTVGVSLGVSAAAAGATFGASLVVQGIVVGIIGAVLLISPIVAHGSINDSVVPFHVRLVLKMILKVLHEDRRFKFSDPSVREKLKHWGMTQRQADLIHDIPPETLSNDTNSHITNLKNKFVQFMVSYLEASTDPNPAPNDPFDKELLKVELQLNTSFPTNANRNRRNAEILNKYRKNREQNIRQNKLLAEAYGNNKNNVVDTMYENPYGSFGSSGGRRTLRRRRTMRKGKSMRRR